jgi:4-amino-4-deoxy-L-arabinose transferase-like glycosyltransferase
MTTFFSTPRWRTWALVVLPVLLLVLTAWRPLAIPDEGRYAEIGRWMWLTGDMLAPRIDGIPFFHKPPLLYWWEVVSYSVFGATSWAARAVVALHAIWMWGLTYVCAKHLVGEALARRVAWILGASVAFLVGGQYVNHDMLVATYMATAIWCFARALMHAPSVHQGFARAGFVACALGVMTKGLIGLLLPGLVLFIWISYTQKWRRVLALPWITGSLLFVALCLPWFVLAEQSYPGMLAYLFGKHQFGRYLGATFNNARPWWFYGVAVSVLLFPWAFWAMADGLHRLRHWRAAHTQEPTREAAVLCWIWVLAILGFFSIPHSKLIGYALPVMPPLALLAALAWQRWVAPRTWERWAFAATVLASVAVAIGANYAAGQFSQERSTQRVAQFVACAIAQDDVLAVVDDFPYDLSFYAQRTRPVEVIQDWVREEREAGDDWRRELMDGVVFDRASGAVLQPMQRLQALREQPHAWVLAPRWQKAFNAQNYAGFESVYDDGDWVVYRGVASARALTESPKSAEQEGLGRCKNQRHE